MISDFYREVAGKELRTGMVIAHQTFGDILRWNPHFHAILLEGGFNEEGPFVYLPFSAKAPPPVVSLKKIYHEGFKGNVNMFNAWNFLKDSNRKKILTFPLTRRMRAFTKGPGLLVVEGLRGRSYGMPVRCFFRLTTASYVETWYIRRYRDERTPPVQ